MTEEVKKQRSDAGKRRALTNVQRFGVMETLKGSGTKDGEKGWLFAEGWSDERIAKMFDCAEHQVASIRRDCFGEIKPTQAPGHSPLAVAFAEIKALRERVERLEAAAARPASEDKTRLVQIGPGGVPERLVAQYHMTKTNGA